MASLSASSEVGSCRAPRVARSGLQKCVQTLEELRETRTRHDGSVPVPRRAAGDGASNPGIQTDPRALQMRRMMVNAVMLVAHELRNPLGPIRTACALLGRVEVDELPRLQAMIERQVVRMTDLIEDLIDMGRAEAGKLVLRRQAVDMRRIVEDVVEDWRSAMGARSQRLDVALPSTAVVVNGDPTRLVQIVSNLLDNACKYTPDGGVVRVSMASTTEELRLVVSDSGIGISAHALPHLFEWLIQEDRAVGFNGGGLGIGLAVVHEFVRAHGGTIQADSAGAGCGSRFVVRLPLLDGRS